MKLASLHFELPEELIAQKPDDYRDEARLMVVNRATGTWEHTIFKKMTGYLAAGDLVVVNDTRVFPARLFGFKEKTRSDIEVFLLRELNHELRLWDALVDPARKIRVGNKIYFGDEDDPATLAAEVVDNTTSRGRTIRFMNEMGDDDFINALESIGTTPLPEYIKRPADEFDDERYQSIFAKNSGAVLAPAASLHISKITLTDFEVKGIDVASVTAHIGLGAYKKIEVEDMNKHKLDSEPILISKETAQTINAAKRNGKKVVAVGNSVLRALECSLTADNTVKPENTWTERFLTPPHDFVIANMLITNFHAPATPYLATTAAFGGAELIMAAYQEAIKEKYEFLDYGDAMMII